MNKGKGMTAMWVLAAFLAFAVFGGNAEAKMTLRMVGFLPLNHHITKMENILKEEVEKNSKGEIEIKFYPAQQLYNHKNSVPALQKGSVEIGTVQTGFWTGVVPSISVMAFPTYFNSFEHYQAVMEGYPGEVFRKDFEEQANVKVVFWSNYGLGEIASKKPIKTLEDFKGLRIRATGGDVALWLQGVGAAPVTMNSGEVYQALQRGTVDGAYSGPSTFDQRKWYEVVGYGTDSSLLPAYAYWTLMHIDTWKKLSPELQKVFLDAGKKAYAYNVTAAVEDDRVGVENTKKRGMVYNKIPTAELARWREKGLPVIIKNYKERVGEAKAQKILDAVEELRKKFQ
jgi:C4-dicarboxylate-binding protein DctP